jgi:hypothetical protein
MKLRAIPGSGQEWLVLDDQDVIVATFHGYKMGSDRPQKLAEEFTKWWNNCAKMYAGFAEKIIGKE